MGYPLTLALRYMGAKKRTFVSVGTAFAILGVMLGVAALSIVISVTGGFKDQFREKVLGVNAHVLVLKYSIDFREYRDVMDKVRNVRGVTGVAPFIINPMMVTHSGHTATGVLLKGVDPELMPTVLDLPKHITEGGLEGLRKADAKPPERRADAFYKDIPPITTTSDAGAPTEPMKPFLDAMRELIEHEADDAGPVSPPPTQPAPTPDTTSSFALPAGDVTPDGGFQSQLPDDDFLPEEYDPDPCRSPEQVAKLPGVVVGKTLAKQLGVGLGDCVQVTSPPSGCPSAPPARARPSPSSSA